MNQQQMQIFIKMNSITELNRIANILYRVFSLCVLSTTILFGQSNLFNSGNNRPVADAGPDIKVQSTNSIQLDASRSFINDGSKLKFEWIFAPGLVYNNENEFSSELLVKPHDSTYLKSIQTYKQVLDVTIADNDLGTQLEVILKVKDRIGFEDTDTLIIEYFDSSVLAAAIDSVQMLADLFDLEVSVLDSERVSQSSSGILIQGLVQDEITPTDVQIVNSIITDQIQTLGFDYEFHLNKDLYAGRMISDLGYRFDCITDSCAAMNAKIVNASYVISWSFDGANGSISMRIFDPENYNDWIDTESISRPLSSISESGIYSLNPSLRTAVSNILDGKIFRKKISRIDRFKMKNKPLLKLGKYPLMLGAVYLLIDKVFLQESEEPPTKPPGFPHDS